LMLISDGGTLVRTRASEVAQTGRNAQGVRLIRLAEDEKLVGVEAIEAVEDEELDVLEETEVSEDNLAETPEAEDAAQDGENTAED